jgi:putative transposase
MALRDGALECPTPLDQQYAQFKTPELSRWLCDVPSQILRNGAVRWRNAKQRQLKGLAKAPRRRNRANFNSVMVTSELFGFRPDVDPATGESVFRLLLGTKSRSLGELKFKAHRPYGLPNVITITRESRNHWYVSFNYAHACDEILRPPAELAYELNGLRDEELEFVSTGADRNVRENCVATSEGVFYTVPAIVKERLTRKAKGRARHQRKLARQQKGSKNRAKTKDKLARNHAYQRNALNDLAHKTSYSLATSDAKRLVFEDLKIRNMVRRPKARQDSNGRWLPNGQHQKAGLSKSILQSAWGRTLNFTQYKAARRNTLVLVVPPHDSSQECSRCGHTQRLRDGLTKGKAVKRVSFRKNSSRAGPPGVPVERV